MTNIRITNNAGEDGGQWEVRFDDDRKCAYVLKVCAEMAAVEPTAGWRVETRGTETIQHRYNEWRAHNLFKRTNPPRSADDSQIAGLH